MVIYKLNFPIYGIIIILSIIIGMLYIFFKLKKTGKSSKEISYFYIIYVTFAFICGKIYTLLIYNSQKNIWTVGLSAYGGLIGVIIGAVVFEKIFYCNKNIIKYTTLSLPLVYGLTKIACFISGCCYGLPYDGVIKVIYSDGLNIGQFPIQIIEAIVFLIIFFVCNNKSNEKNITYKTLFIVFLFKFILDFFRYEHLNALLSRNQIVSIFLMLILVIIKKTKVLDNFLNKNN